MQENPDKTLTIKKTQSKGIKSIGRTINRKRRTTNRERRTINRERRTINRGRKGNTMAISPNSGKNTDTNITNIPKSKNKASTLRKRNLSNWKSRKFQSKLTHKRHAILNPIMILTYWCWFGLYSTPRRPKIAASSGRVYGTNRAWFWRDFGRLEATSTSMIASYFKAMKTANKTHLNLISSCNSSLPTRRLSSKKFGIFGILTI